jgi:Oligosaccharide biosynthesis protein Alg14 like
MGSIESIGAVDVTDRVRGDADAFGLFEDGRSAEVAAVLAPAELTGSALPEAALPEAALPEAVLPEAAPVASASNDTVIDLRGTARLRLPRPAGRVLLVGSSGGHLAQMVPIAQLWNREDRAWVTFDTPDARSQLDGERTFWAHHPTTRNLKNLARNAVLAAHVLRRVHPDLVISTGAGVAVPFFAAARAAGIPTAYLEVYDRIDTATLTGRLCRPLSSLFMVQWDEQLVQYPGAVNVGHVL